MDFGVILEGSDCNVIHEEVVSEVRKKLKILYALMEAEMCVCDISVLLGMTKSSVSHQLRILKQSNLVKYRKAGRVVYYSLADEHVYTIVSAAMEHVMEEV